MYCAGKSAKNRFKSEKFGFFLCAAVVVNLVARSNVASQPVSGQKAVLPNGRVLDVPPAGVAFCNKHYQGGLKGALGSKLERLFWDAHTSMYKNKYQVAIDSFTAFINHFKSSKERSIYKTQDMANFMLGRAYQGRGYCYLMLKKYQPGIDDLNLSIKYRPDYKETWLNRANAYKLIGRQDLADRDFEHASHMRPHKLPDFIEKSRVAPIQDTPVQGMPD